MAVSYQEALELLDTTARTPEALLNLVKQVSVDAQGSVTVLYSGDMPDGTKSGAVIAQMLTDGADIRVIDKSAAGQLLVSEKFRTAVGQAFGLTDAEIDDLLQNRSFAEGSPGHRAVTWLYGAEASSGPWADVSRRFAEATSGEVRLLVANALPDRIFNQVELPALLQNDRISSISGYTPSDLKLLYPESGGVPPDTTRLFVDLQDTSNRYILRSGIKLELTVSGKRVTGEFLHPLLHADAQFASLHPSAEQRWQDYLDNLRGRDEAKLRAIESISNYHRESAISLLKRGEAFAISAGKRLGAIGGFVALSLVAGQAAAAERAGDHAKAKELLAEFAAETAASELGQIVGGLAATAVVGIAAASGAVVAAPVAGAFILGTALLGGFFGGEAGKDFYNSLKDRDQNGRRDLVDKLANLLFGATSTITTPIAIDTNGGKFSLDASLTAAEIQSGAANSIAWRFGLRELSSFVLKDISYDQYNTDGTLDLFDPATGQGSMTSDYIADRAAMLAWKLRYERRGAQDADDLERTGPKPYNEDWDTSQLAGNWDYVDLTQRLPGGAPLQLSIDGTGITLHDHQIVFGSANDDTISGEGESDRLYGAGGNDTIEGKDGDDYLEGGAGNDTYKFAGSFGHDTLLDTDGRGVIQIDGYALGEAKGSGKRNVWIASLPDDKYAVLSLREGPGGTGHVLVITPEHSPDKSITIRNFDLAKAQGEGYLGIKLAAANRVALLAQPANFWEDPGADLSSLAGRTRHLNERGATNFGISLSQAARAGETVTIQIQGLSGQGMGILVNGETHTGDNVTVQLTEGQTQVGFAVVHEGELSADVVGSIKVVFNGQAGTAESNTWAVSLHDTGAPSATLTGDFMAQTRTASKDYIRYDYSGRPVTTVHEGGVEFVLDSNGNLVAGGDTLVTNNTIYGTEDNDEIDGGVGEDLLAGHDGDDKLIGGAGSDMLLGGDGNDSLLGGDGNDYLSSASYAEVGTQQYGPDDIWAIWLPPANATVHASGGAWGVFSIGNVPPQWAGTTLVSTTAQSDFIDGGAGDDEIFASFGADRILGGEGNDQAFGLGGDDVLDGGADDDKLWGDGFPIVVGMDSAEPGTHGRDYIDGGDGHDIIYGGGLADDLRGGTGDDRIWGDNGEPGGSADFLAHTHHGGDYIDGGEGDDTLVGNGGDDTLYGGVGDDFIIGDTRVELLAHHADEALAWGADYLLGGAGADWMIGGGGNDTLFGGEDNDWLEGDESDPGLPGQFNGSDYLNGEGGDDLIKGGGSGDVLYGGSGNDILIGDDGGQVVAGAHHGDDYLDGEDGNDELTGSGGSDHLVGGIGHDILRGDDDLQHLETSFHGDDQLDGGDGNDQLVGGGGSDRLVGGRGNDVLWGEGGAEGADFGANTHDVLDGGEGDDELHGEAGNDDLSGGEGHDHLDGGDGNDTLDGGAGMNYVFGGAGDDLLISSGNDYLKGGSGNDTYDLRSIARAGALPVIDDHEGVNTLVLGGSAGEYRLYVEGGATYVADGDGIVAEVAQGSDLSGLFIEEAGNSVSALDLVPADGPTGRVRSMAWVDGQLTLTAGIADDQHLIGGSFAEALEGGAGNDETDGGDGDDVLTGGAGDDSLAGGEGSDLIVGGAGNDLIVGSSADGAGDEQEDVFLFRAGDGLDRIEGATRSTDGVARDAIAFGEGISATDISIQRGGFDAETGDAEVVISYGAGDRITVAQGGFAHIAEIRFADGSVLRQEDILRDLAGATEERIHDSRASVAGAQVLIGGQAADRLLGGWANDILIGGAGRDVLSGGEGRNTYIFTADSDLDQIVLGGEEEHGVLRFLDASLSELQVFEDEGDFIVRQASGAMVRVRDLLSADVDLEGWHVVDRDGQQVSVESLLEPTGDGAQDLEERRQQFMATQHLRLATTPQRGYYPNGDNDFPVYLSTPTSVQQQALQVDESGLLRYENYLTVRDIVKTTVTYQQTAVYRTVRTMTASRPGRFWTLEQIIEMGYVPQGAVPVKSATTSPGGSREWVGYLLPEVPGGSGIRTVRAGTISTPVYQQTVTTDDTATQRTVTGTDGDDLIEPGWQANGNAALFRGSISTGAGNDHVLLASGSNATDAPGWSRWDEWRGIQSFAEGYIESSSSYDRGLGAWIDLGEGDDVATGTDGNDFIVGGAGSDAMDGQAGADTYFISFRPGDVDRISDLAYVGFYQMPWEIGGFEPPNADTVEFDATIQRETLSYRWIRASNDAGDVADGPGSQVLTLQLYAGGAHFLDIDYLGVGAAVPSGQGSSGSASPMAAPGRAMTCSRH